MTAQVVDIRPKTMNRRYRNHSYTVTFVKETKEWRWEVEYVQVTKFNGEAPTMIKAFKAAEKHIDNTLKLRGK